MFAALISGALLGLLSLPHCAAMCGPLAAAACARTTTSTTRRGSALRYQAGRTFGYGVAGALCGHVGRVLHLIAPGLTAIALFSGLAASACLWVAYTLVRRGAASTPLVQLGTAPRRSSWLATLARLLPRDPAALGVLSALLPCGVLGAALLSAVATSDATLGASVMLGFVTSSGLALVTAGALARAVPAHASAAARRVVALALVVAAVMLIAKPVALWAAPARSANGALQAHHCH